MPSLSGPLISALAVAELAVASSFQQPGWKIGQSVKTSSGSVVGHASPWKPEVSEYLGIPFAKPPVGELRWAAPKKYEGNGTIGAHKFSPSCPAVVSSPPTSKMSYESVLVTVGSMAALRWCRGTYSSRDVGASRRYVRRRLSNAQRLVKATKWRQGKGSHGVDLRRR
jgi:Carboxylesterase family